MDREDVRERFGFTKENKQLTGYHTISHSLSILKKLLGEGKKK